MRLSAFFSLVAHVSVVAAGLWVSQGEAYKPEPSTPMIVIPLELMTIGEVTDIAPVVADAPKEEEAAAVEEVTETFTSASAPKPAEDVVNLEAAPPPPPPKKEEVKKPEAKPAPAKKEEDLNSFLDSMLTDVKKDKPKAAPAPAGAKTATAETGPARMGAGEMRRTQVTVQDYIRAQLVNKRCWTDHSDMADAATLRTVFRVRFSNNGKFAVEPELREPSRPPGGGPLLVFIEHARTALQKCNNLGWQVPPEYFKLEPAPYWIDIEFLPKIGAQ
ncbi:MAG TPA: hypothetical protein PK080_14235 [Hyphomonadaceae bacterium]|nr:hypothetical protein [Hyphomonadaceae bacterium]